MCWWSTCACRAAQPAQVRVTPQVSKVVAATFPTAVCCLGLSLMNIPGAPLHAMAAHAPFTCAVLFNILCNE